MLLNVTETIINRFEAKYMPEPMSGCWLWIGSRTPFGYGEFWIKSQRYGAHRLSYLLNVGPIPDGMHVLHKCDIPQCINPSHLFIGTHSDNMWDKSIKGRHNTPLGEGIGNSKLTERSVEDILQKRKAGKYIWELAMIFGVSKTCIQNVLCGLTWSHVTGITKK